MEHVIIAWGTVLVTALLLFWIFQVITRVIRHQQISQLDFFDGFLMITLLIGSAASIYTLAQIDGNLFFILVYAVAAISTVRITGYWLKTEETENIAAVTTGGATVETKKILRSGICLLTVPFFLFNT